MDLKVFPNPADDHVVIETGYDQPSLFKLFDPLGVVVIQAEVADQEQLSLAHLEAGTFQYKLISGSRLQVGKLKIIRNA